MTFLREDLHAIAEPTAVELRDYYQQHRDNYTVPATVSFTHIYYADAAGRARAAQALQKLRAQPAVRTPAMGDRFAAGYDYTAIDAREAERLFGATPFADALFQAPPGRWAGPFESGYGWHLLYVQARQPARQPPLEDVREAVLADYHQDARRRDNAAALAQLRDKYTIVRADGTHD
jgi:parvulin-like peptidyl-prolyl isomerase